MSGVPESDEDVAGSFLRSSLCSDFVKYIFNEKTVSDSHENVEKLISWRIYIKIVFFARCQKRTCSQLLHKATSHPSPNPCLFPKALTTIYDFFKPQFLLSVQTKVYNREKYRQDFELHILLKLFTI